MITIDHACIINNADLYQYIDIENLIELKIPLPLFIEKDKSIVNAFFDIKQVKYIEQFRNLILQKLHNHIQNRKYMHLYISNIIEFLLKEAKVHLDDQYLPTLYTKHPLVQRLTQYIHKHIHEPLTTKQVSKAFYISQSYISILFSKILNMNFKQYTSSLKIALSLFDLLEKEQSIYDVALKYSYTNVSTYSKNFKFYVKMPPKYYIHQFRKNDLNSPYQVSLSTSNLTKIINKMYNFSHNQHISSNQIVLDKLKYTHKFNVTRTFITFEDLHKLISFNRSNFSIKILSLISKPNLILLHTNFDDLNKLDYHNVFEAIKQLLIKGFEITLKVDNPPFSQTIDY
ncbi:MULTISPECIES: helix-turn-helix domain-containing protein [unclassified Staphylococcus]|uniref:helix-turn-helix domain-containing protein n=1 Tax=Staphylococcus TaxID=1279 RepID=UPI001AEC64FD|nr:MULTISPECIES: helix-turn-helix domain-containing protein [unclassified Staphylococcus]